MQKPMRIIQVVNVRWFNATAWYGLFLSRLLKDAGHDVLVLGLEGTESFKKAQDMGLEPQGFKHSSSSPLFLPESQRIVKNFRPDVVNCHRGEGMIFWGMLKAMGAPFALVRTRGDQRPPKNSFANRYLHTKLTDAVIATNSRTVEEYVNVLGLAPAKVHKIIGGVDDKKFRPSVEGRERARGEFGFGPEDLVVGLLGRFDTVKGQLELIRAIKRLRDGQDDISEGKPSWRLNIRLLLAGFPTSTSREEVEKWIEEAKLGDITVISGKYPDVSSLISAMDLGVVASQGSETIARAALEIMQCGVPLVGTNVGVMPDLLPGYALASAGDENGLVNLLEGFLSSAEMRKSLSEVNTVRIADLSSEKFLEQTLAVYRSVCKRG